MTTTQQKKMQAGKARKKKQRETAYSRWVRRDAELYAALARARSTGVGADTAERRWKENMRAMPEVPGKRSKR